MIPLAGVAGGLIVAGIVLLVLELTRRQPAPGLPARHGRQLSPAARKRLLLAIGTGLVVLAVTRWPVAGIVAVAAVAVPAADHLRPRGQAPGRGARRT